MDDFTLKIIISAVCGLLGGLGNILLSQESLVLPRRFVDDKGNTHYLFGCLKEFGIGLIVGPLSVLPLLQSLPIGYVIYLSLVSGVGGGAILNAIVNRELKEIKSQRQSVFHQLNIQPLTQQQQPPQPQLPVQQQSQQSQQPPSGTQP